MVFISNLKLLPGIYKFIKLGSPPMIMIHLIAGKKINLHLI